MNGNVKSIYFFFFVVERNIVFLNVMNAKYNYIITNHIEYIQIICHLILLRIEPFDTRNKFNKCDEQQQNRAHISSFHRVNSQPHVNYSEKTHKRIFCRRE